MKQSTIPGARGGAFARYDMEPRHEICCYAGDTVPAAQVHEEDYRHGYVMYLGNHYVDARDDDGRLIMSNGVHRDVHDLSHADWGKIKQVGIGWAGTANLSRFVNRENIEGTSNVVFSKGILRVGKRRVQAGEELLGSHLLFRDMPF